MIPFMVFSANAQSIVKRIVTEEFTGSWCGACPIGSIALCKMEKKYPEKFIGIAIHIQDPMESGDFKSGLNFYSGLNGYPTAFMSRKNVNKNNGIYPDFPSIEAEYKKELALAAPVAVKLNIQYDKTTRKATIKVTGDFVKKLTGDYRFNVVLTEDNVKGTGSGYDQSNYYTGTNNSNVTACGDLPDFNTAPKTVPAADMNYDHVARAILGGYQGKANSLPASIASGSSHSATFTYTLPANFKVENMHVIGWVNKNKGEILNAAIGKFKTSSSVFETNNLNRLNVYPVPARDILNIQSPVVLKNHEVRVVDLSGRLVKTVLLNETSEIKLDISDLSKGIYILELFSNESSVKEFAQKIIVD